VRTDLPLGPGAQMGQHVRVRPGEPDPYQRAAALVSEALNGRDTSELARRDPDPVATLAALAVWSANALRSLTDEIKVHREREADQG
jgi:hypothetical protein